MAIFDTVGDDKDYKYDTDTRRKKAKLHGWSKFNILTWLLTSSNTRRLYVLICGIMRRWLCIENQHIDAFLHKFLQHSNHYCSSFNLISIYFTPLEGFYWGCAGFITLISPRSEGQAEGECFSLLVSIELGWFGYLLLILSSFIVFCTIRILFITTLRYSLCIYCWIKYSSSLL